MAVVLKVGSAGPLGFVRQGLGFRNASLSSINSSLSCHGWFSVLQLSCLSGSETGCVLSPIIFNLLLVAMTLASHRDLQSSDCVGIMYRLDGGLFNLRRLQTKTRTSSAVILALHYADDAAFPSLTADGLQRSLDVMSEAYLRAGLAINTTKKEIIVHHQLLPQLFLLVGISLKTLKILFTSAQISHFLVTSQMRFKDELALPHHHLVV